MQIRDHVFVVTGGGNGIGRETVLALLRDGAHVAAVDLREPALTETARLAGAPDRLTLHTADVSDEAAVSALAEDVLAAHGHVDGLINVAGIIQKFAKVADLSHAEIEKVMAVNFWGVVHTTRAFLPALRSRPAASLVNVSSMGALVPVPGQSAYGASKAAVKLFTEGLYAELHGTPVAVTVVFPGGVATAIAENSGSAIPGQQSDTSGMEAKLTKPADAAAQIVDAVRTGRFRVRIGGDARLLDRLSRLAPRRATELVARRMSALLG
ncbi:SDR family NAD(P)-dependent oxidoreductase [Cellulomonas sp. ICMP 17802]|uniref:SDR family NAD(P)-dependent oxidoreductase n=1 Tax=Cellulomonas sp. ICMP 17802 TaxID=3239199 RepID=UPI00351B57D5